MLSCRNTMAMKGLRKSTCFVLFAVYGIAAFIRRKAGIYLLLKSHFVYFDYAEPVFFFLLDYLAIMTLFALRGQAVVSLFSSVIVSAKTDQYENDFQIILTNLKKMVK